MSFENTYDVEYIKNTHDIVCFCPLGQDYYSAKINITIVSPERIPDYCDSDKFVNKLSGEHKIIEDLACEIARYFKAETNAVTVAVEAEVTNAAHSPVKITVTM